MKKLSLTCKEIRDFERAYRNHMQEICSSSSSSESEDSCNDVGAWQSPCFECAVSNFKSIKDDIKKQRDLTMHRASSGKRMSNLHSRAMVENQTDSEVGNEELPFVTQLKSNNSEFDSLFDSYNLYQVIGDISCLSLQENANSKADSDNKINDCLISHLLIESLSNSSSDNSSIKVNVSDEMIELPDTDSSNDGVKRMSIKTQALLLSQPSTSQDTSNSSFVSRVFTHNAECKDIKPNPLELSNLDSSSDDDQSSDILNRNSHRKRKKRISFRASDDAICKSNSEICEEGAVSEDSDTKPFKKIKRCRTVNNLKTAVQLTKDTSSKNLTICETKKRYSKRQVTPNESPGTDRTQYKKIKRSKSTER